jgi:hypothetical protein
MRICRRIAVMRRRVKELAALAGSARRKLKAPVWLSALHQFAGSPWVDIARYRVYGIWETYDF